jgi:pimeloyl-ACP methyl ester carboxylesterase
MHGLGGQLTMWSEDLFCKPLAACGYRVIRYDSRDSGKSQIFSALGDPDVLGVLSAKAAGRPVDPPPYGVADLALDACGLLDALGVERAHVVGFSMGGVVAQVMAIRHPERVRAATLMATTSHHPSLPHARPHVLERFMSIPDDFYDKGQIVAKSMKIFEVLEGTHFRMDPAVARARAERNFDRFHDPAANHRLTMAIALSGDRTEALRTLRTPVQIIHGQDDAMTPIENGRQLADIIPGARLREIEGMGHVLADSLCPIVVEAIDAFDCETRGA